jgi:hypothetical protein
LTSFKPFFIFIDTLLARPGLFVVAVVVLDTSLSEDTSARVSWVLESMDDSQDPKMPSLYNNGRRRPCLDSVPDSMPAAIK